MDIGSQQSASRGNGSVANPEVAPRATRRRFTAAYKAAILEEVSGSPDQTGAILRREGLYSSHLTNWRKQARAATVKALSKKRGRKGKSTVELENEKLRREVARLQRELEKSQILVDAQKKLAVILGVDLPKLSELSEDE